MSKIITAVSALGFFIGLGATVFFSKTWWERFQMPYDETARYWDGLVVWHEQAVVVYAILALVSLAITIVMALIYRKKIRHQDT